MGSEKGQAPTICVDCGNYLLPWTVILIDRRYYLGRPCPRVECQYVVLEQLRITNDDTGWAGDWY